MVTGLECSDSFAFVFLAADDMGLGKTLTMIALALRQKQLAAAQDKPEDPQAKGKDSIVMMLSWNVPSAVYFYTCSQCYTGLNNIPCQ